MNIEFVDTNILVYAHEGGAGEKHRRATALVQHLIEGGAAALSVQVLTEFYAVATRKLSMSSAEAEEIIADLAAVMIHRLHLQHVLGAIQLQRRHGISWRDALILQSAIELGCRILWTEDLAHGQRFGPVTVKNPFLASAPWLH
jgi:predicted nucleic acid-binding protein